MLLGNLTTFFYNYIKANIYICILCFFCVCAILQLCNNVSQKNVKCCLYMNKLCNSNRKKMQIK